MKILPASQRDGLCSYELSELLHISWRLGVGDTLRADVRVENGTDNVAQSMNVFPFDVRERKLTEYHVWYRTEWLERKNRLIEHGFEEWEVEEAMAREPAELKPYPECVSHIEDCLLRECKKGKNSGSEGKYSDEREDVLSVTLGRVMPKEQVQSFMDSLPTNLFNDDEQGVQQITEHMDDCEISEERARSSAKRKRK